MKLKRLIVHGFKSFKDRTTIQFDDGITGIVGPNGCGKSNIVDALFWVMGAQSAKHLRGDSMKDLIFAGSSKYTPGAWAEVSLVLDNDTGKHIHIGNKVVSPTEIQLTRKLYRNGETEYRINGQPCRLKDIQEVFMDTGAGAKSYSIIAQGEINRLVQSKPEERRTMIEDVAGITKFKVRKKESQKKIEQTEANLARLNDLQIEIDKNLKSLQKQAEKAEKARSLKEKIQRNDLVVSSHKVFDQLKEYKELKVALNEITIELENWRTRKETIEISLEEERFQQTEEREKLEDFQKEFNEISKKLAAAEERLNYLRKGIEQKDELIASRQQEIEEINSDIENRTERLESLTKEREDLENFGNEEHDFTELAEKVESLKEQVELREDQVSDLRDDVSDLKEELDSVEKEVFRNSSKLEEYATSLEDITVEIEALEKQYSGVSGEIADERDAANNAEKEAEALKNQEEGLREIVQKLNTETRELEKEYNERSKEKIKVESTLSSLKEIAASLEGVKEGATDFLGAADQQGFDLFGNLIKCDEIYTKAVQRLLNDFMETLVSSNTSFDSFYSWLKGNQEKGVDFLVCSADGDSSNESLERLKLRCGEITTLDSIIELPEEYSHIKALFNGRYIVEKLDEDIFAGLSSEINFKSLTTFDGHYLVRNVGGAKLLSVAGNSDAAGGMVERNNRINELEDRLVTLTDEVGKLEESVEAKTAELEQRRNEFEDVRNAAAEKKAEAQVKKSAIEAKLKGYESSNARLDILKSRKSEISKSRIDLLEGEDKLNRKQEEIKEALEDKNSRLDDLLEELQDLRETYSNEKDELRALELQAKSFEDRLKSTTSQLEDVESQITRYKEKLVSNNEIIERYTEEIESMTDEADALDAENRNTASELADKEDVLSIMKDQLAELMISMQERETEVKKLSSNINDAEKKINKFEITMQQNIIEEEVVTRDIFERYQIDLRHTLCSYLEYTDDERGDLNDISSMYYIETESGPQEIERVSYEFTRRYGQDLKDCGHKLRQYKGEYARLGEINWQAIEDYERQKKRFDFLKEQEIELRQSLTDLEEAINHIDQKSRERFKIAFDEVDARFKKVFPIIFGGGEARLEVTGDMNDPECGVNIIAKPPGKKMQVLNLMSGGEKAMTAVSLIFSIFLVKPSPFCLLDEVDAPLDDANVGRFNELLREMSKESQFILITHNKKTMEMNDTLYGVTMQEPGVSKAVSVQLH